VTDPQPTTRRDLFRPVQLVGLAAAAALFAGFVTLMSMGFFEDRGHATTIRALVVALVATGITFVVTLVVMALLLLAVDPTQITKRVDRAVLLPPEDESPASGTDAGQAPQAPQSPQAP